MALDSKAADMARLALAMDKVSGQQGCMCLCRGFMHMFTSVGSQQSGSGGGFEQSGELAF